MLKITGPGWAEIKIGDRVICEASYLTDVPLDFLKALYDYFNKYDAADKRFSSSVYVDLEGSFFNFVFTTEDGTEPAIFIIYKDFTKGGVLKIEKLSTDPYFLAKELIDDIEKDMHSWVDFMDYGSETEEYKASRKKEITFWLNKLEDVIKDEKPYAEKFKAWNTPGTPENEEIERVRILALEGLKNGENDINYEHIEKHMPKKDK